MVWRGTSFIENLYIDFAQSLETDLSPTACYFITGITTEWWALQFLMKELPYIRLDNNWSLWKKQYGTGDSN